MKYRELIISFFVNLSLKKSIIELIDIAIPFDINIPPAGSKIFDEFPFLGFGYSVNTTEIF